jgi:hypothetical protein
MVFWLEPDLAVGNWKESYEKKIADLKNMILNIRLTLFFVSFLE